MIDINDSIDLILVAIFCIARKQYVLWRENHEVPSCGVVTTYVEKKFSD